ncbi:iron chelate uptake ABC transporter family permease subunit [Curtobacterium sp. VKM Ac-2922]|uniref:FecCD family ABC transporter permease n=1 Tax=Curtobacterium sp. VKM Ac-2922 TaxID=2929475 RepID=UPI001FB56D35|nr:iron chelate uptake ABC transporter family permease subunit [Curtobacterium sp. VKM Ac-2922]MCJ1714190.1 iron ABC transporter permease [Curtobacterium sp. VKM Ac-2922]
MRPDAAGRGVAPGAASARQGVRIGPVGLAWRPRVFGMTIGAVVVALLLVVLGVAIGSTWITPGVVIRSLLGLESGPDAFIVTTLRLPRVLTGALVGLTLAVAGALTQTFTRNPLGTPDIIGVTSGASVGAVAAVVLGGGSASISALVLGGGIPVAATVGALVAAAVVYGLGWRGGVQSYRLVLVGIGVSATLDAMTSYLLVRAQITQATAASQWLVGSLSSTSWSAFWPLLLVAAVAVPIALATSAALGIGQLGDEVAVGVGLGIQRHRLLVIALAVVLTAAAVAAAGPVGFVAFVVPQVALRLAGTNRPPLLLSAALGAVLVLGADLLARSAFPWQVPVGIVTTVIGAPYLIWLLVRHRKEMSR